MHHLLSSLLTSMLPHCHRLVKMWQNAIPQMPKAMCIAVQSLTIIITNTFKITEKNIQSTCRKNIISLHDTLLYTRIIRILFNKFYKVQYGLLYSDHSSGNVPVVVSRSNHEKRKHQQWWKGMVSLKPNTMAKDSSFNWHHQSHGSHSSAMSSFCSSPKLIK